MTKGVPRPPRVPIQSLVLRTLFVSGAIGVALVAPKLTRLFPYFDRPHQARKRSTQRVQQAITRLERRGLIKASNGPAILTKSGTDEVEKIMAYEYQITEPTFWDGKWRMVIFDVYEKNRKRRNELRLLLEGAGFVLLQQSVWVHPYPCDDFIELIRAHLGHRKDEMFYFTATDLQPDKKLRAHFGLG